MSNEYKDYTMDRYDELVDIVNKIETYCIENYNNSAESQTICYDILNIINGDFIETARALLKDASEEDILNLVDSLADLVLQSKLLTKGCVTNQVNDYLEKNHTMKILDNKDFLTRRD